MTKYLIYIYIDKNKHSEIYSYGNSLKVNVSEINPFDRLSKKFKLYTHTIQYTNNGLYKYDDYYFEVYDPNSYFRKYLLKYSKPLIRIVSVDIFFQATDTKNKNPLVLGFKEVGQPTVYYTANFLYYDTSGLFAHKVKNYTLPRGSFPEHDLLTRLLEELGLHVTDRKEKLVIRLEKKTGSNTKYPDSGHFTKKITLKKTSYYEHFEKYNHFIDGSLHEILFYLSFNNDSLYFDGGQKHKKINSIDAYYCKYYKDEPIIFVLKFSNYKNYLYKYSDFRKDAGKSNLVKKLSELRDVEDNELLKTLVDELDKTNKTTTFLICYKFDGYSSSVHVKPGEETNAKYKKYSHYFNGTQTNKANIFLKNERFLINYSLYTSNVTEITGYFLKSVSNSQEDELPFLIEIKPDVAGPSEYYSKSNDDDVNWIKLDVNISLESILENFDEVVHDFTQAREYVYETLGLKSSEEEDDEDEDEDEEEEEEDEVPGIGYSELKDLVRSHGGLDYAVSQGHIGTLSGLKGLKSFEGEEEPVIVQQFPEQQIEPSGSGITKDTVSRTSLTSEEHVSTVRIPGQHPEGKPLPGGPQEALPTPLSHPAHLPAEKKPTEKKPVPEPSVIATAVVRSPGSSSQDHSQRAITSDKDSRAKSPAKSTLPPSHHGPQLPQQKGPPETTKAKGKEKEPRRSSGLTSSSTQVPQKLEKTRHEQGTPVKTKTTKLETFKYLVFILLDQKHNYSFRQFYNFFQSLDKFSREDVLNTKDEVSVNPKQGNNWDQFKHGQYGVYEHDFEKSLRDAPYKPNQVELKLIININSVGSVLTLYRPDKIHQSLKLSYKSGKNKIHVYFYRYSTKPLIFCYNGYLYMPKSQVDYDKKWFKISGIKCPCSSPFSYTVELLLLELKKIAEFLKLFERSETQTFDYHSSPESQVGEDTTQSSVPSTATIAGASVGSVVGTAAVSGGVTVALRPELIVTSIRALL